MPDCHLDRYMNLNEGQDVLDLEEVEFYESICSCEDCEIRSRFPVMPDPEAQAA